MDFPRLRRKLTWRDSIWWRATWQSLVSGIAMLALAMPFILYLFSQVLVLAHLHRNLAEITKETAMGGLMLLPYLWLYFFALERIAKRSHYELPPRPASNREPTYLPELKERNLPALLHPSPVPYNQILNLQRPRASYRGPHLGTKRHDQSASTRSPDLRRRPPRTCL